MPLFEEQDVVDRLVQQIAYYFAVPRICLHVVSAGKGLMAGNVEFDEDGHSHQDLREGDDRSRGLQISEFTEKYANLRTGAQFILVVEKETVFFKLINEQDGELLKQALIITGKGYPDYATKKFVKMLNYRFAAIPIFFLGDCDPYGFDILCKYCFGTELTLYEYDTIPGIIWLGMFEKDLLRRASGQQLDQILISTTEADRKKINELMDQNYFTQIQQIGAQNPQIKRWRQWAAELLQMSHFKYELEQSYGCLAQTLSQFILSKLAKEEYI